MIYKIKNQLVDQVQILHQSTPAFFKLFAKNASKLIARWG